MHRIRGNWFGVVGAHSCPALRGRFRMPSTRRGGPAAMLIPVREPPDDGTGLPGGMDFFCRASRLERRSSCSDLFRPHVVQGLHSDDGFGVPGGDDVFGVPGGTDFFCCASRLERRSSALIFSAFQSFISFIRSTRAFKN